MTSDASWTSRRPRVGFGRSSQCECCWVVLAAARACRVVPVEPSRVESSWVGPGYRAIGCNVGSAQSTTGRWWLGPGEHERSAKKLLSGTTKLCMPQLGTAMQKRSDRQPYGAEMCREGEKRNVRLSVASFCVWVEGGSWFTAAATTHHTPHASHLGCRSAEFRAQDSEPENWGRQGFGGLHLTSDTGPAAQWVRVGTWSRRARRDGQ